MIVHDEEDDEVAEKEEDDCHFISSQNPGWNSIRMAVQLPRRTLNRQLGVQEPDLKQSPSFHRGSVLMCLF